MILIADSGSTKTQWFLTDSTNYRSFDSIGYNPVFLSTTEILSSLKASLLPQIDDVSVVQRIVFYGAGCAAPSAQTKMQEILAACFPAATSIEVMSDLWACIHATCGHDAGICCILGTGSNACVFDGAAIVGQMPSLGYLLGDEGSGRQIGGALLQAFFYREMPDPLAQAFADTYQLSEHVFVKTLYEHPRPNRFLASFAEFAQTYRQHPFIQKLLADCFETFVQKQILKLNESALYPLYFVGSVAFGFKEELAAALDKHGFVVKNVQKSPFPALLEYYL